MSNPIEPTTTEEHDELKELWDKLTLRSTQDMALIEAYVHKSNLEARIEALKEFKERLINNVPTTSITGYEGIPDDFYNKSKDILMAIEEVTQLLEGALNG